MMRLPPWFANFVAEVHSDLEPALADGFERAFREIEAEGVTNRHARRFMLAVRWILSQPRTLLEKVEALGKLSDLPRGPVIVNMQQLTGW
jgi:hypothetical protein